MSKSCALSVCSFARCILRFAFQCCFIGTIAAAGEWIVDATRLPLPGPLAGIALLIALLACGIVKLRWVEHGADVLVRHLTVFFLPVTVGIDAALDQLGSNSLGTAAAVLASVLTGIAAAGLTADRLRRLTMRSIAEIPSPTTREAS